MKEQPWIHTSAGMTIKVGWISIKTVILRNALLSTFTKNIKQLTYAGYQSEIPPNSSRFRINRKYCYQSATKFSKACLTRVLRYFTRMGLCGVHGLTADSFHAATQVKWPMFYGVTR